jgi:hypothetical protein
MSNRRSFFKKLIGATLAPFLPIPKSESITIPIESVPVYAGTRKLKISWSIELEQDLMVLYGINLQDAVTNCTAKEEQLNGELV